jgi:[NiFe] hydrogenase small subunit
MGNNLPQSTDNKEVDVSRRDFLKFCSLVAAAMGLGPAMGSKVAAALTSTSPTRPKILWLHLSECTGCTEAALRSIDPFFDDLILSAVSLDYHETLLAGAGASVHDALRKAAEDNKGKFICVVEGAIPTKDGYGMVGGMQMKDIAKEICFKAKYNIAIGNCAAFGGIPNAAPNPSGAKGLIAAISTHENQIPHIVNIPGCPPNPIAFMGVVTWILLYDSIPATDIYLRPFPAYVGTVHNNKCEWKDHMDDKDTRCMRKKGCKGPCTPNICTNVGYNNIKKKYPMDSGHVCIGCSNPFFWDNNTPFWKRIYENTVYTYGSPTETPTANEVFGFEVGVLPHSLKSNPQTIVPKTNVTTVNGLGRKIKTPGLNKAGMKKQPLGHGVIFEKTNEKAKKMIHL